VTIHSQARASAGRGLLFVMLAAVSWGTVGVTTKALYGMSAATPLSVGFFRLALAVPALLVASWSILRGRLFQLTRRDLALVGAIGVMTALYQVCYFSAIPRVGVAVATLVTLCAAPLMVALLSAVLLRERPTARVATALGVALVGTGLLVGGAPVTARAASTAGTLLALASALGYAVVTLCSRSLSPRCHPAQTLAIAFSLGAVLLLGATLPAGPELHFPPRGWVLLAYLGLVPTALAYALFVWGLRSVPATVASVATLLEPLTSTTLAWALFGERLGRLGGVGALLLGAAMLTLCSSAVSARPPNSQHADGSAGRSERTPER
jgi:DME family drug/metabolite transporter